MHFITLVALATLCLPAATFADTEVHLGNDALDHDAGDNTGSRLHAGGLGGGDQAISPPRRPSCEGDNDPNSRRKVCGNPPMPQCVEGLACAQVMPEPKTYANCAELNRAQAGFRHMGACEGGGRRPHCPGLNRIVLVDMEKVEKADLVKVFAIIGGATQPRIGTHSLHSREDADATIFGIHPMERMACSQEFRPEDGADPLPNELRECQADGMERIRASYEQRLEQLRRMKGVQVHCEHRARTMQGHMPVDDASAGGGAAE